MNDTVTGPTVEGILALCLEGFHRSCSKLKNAASSCNDCDVDAELSNEYDRLKLWAYDVNASSGELDRALTSSSSLRDFTVNLLSELHGQLSSPETVLIRELLDDIKDIIDNLISIEPALRSPAPLDTVQDGPEVKPSQLSTGKREMHFVVSAQRMRYATGKPDLDVVVVPGLLGDFGNEQRHSQASPSEWTNDLLPNILEENGIYVRVMTFYYESPSWLGGNINQPSRLGVDEFVTKSANQLVKDLNRARLQDPGRALFFVSHSMGGLIAKGAASILVKEGLSVNPDNPISGCMFFAVPHDNKGEDLLMWLDTFITLGRETPPREALIFQMGFIAHVNSQFLDLSERQGIEIVSAHMFDGDVVMTDSLATNNAALGLCRELSFDLMDRETALPLVHRIASTALREVPDVHGGPDDTLSSAGQSTRPAMDQNEDPFAMLVAYDTVILVNDSSSTSETAWTSVINMVRDCVDIVIGYRDDLDIQLYQCESTSFSVNESSKASRILSAARPPGVPWDLDAQLRRYIRKYLASDSSILRGGILKPCNMIVFTSHAPIQSPSSFLETVSSLVEKSSSLSAGQLRLCVQLVLLGDDMEAAEFCKRLDILVMTNRSTNVAPTLKVSSTYTSDAAICQCILLGAISPRFAFAAFKAQDLGMLIPNDPIGGSDTASNLGSTTLTDNSTTFWSGGSVGSVGTTFDVYIQRLDLIDSQVKHPPTDSPIMDHSLEDPWPTLDPYSQFAPIKEEQRPTESQLPSSTTLNSYHGVGPFPEEMPPPPQSVSRETHTSEQELSLRHPTILGEPRRASQTLATFRCNLCPKVFSRAYNLRAHVRSHTDERKYTCGVCGKAFAREHDRKRHEGLHAGEKKFVCRGQVTNGSQWGCGRRFARAAALARHFRSEAGLVCIKPLYDEEARERRNLRMKPAAQETMDEEMPDAGAFKLPAALLEEYPALAKVNWNEIRPTASNDHWESEGYVSGPGI